MRAALSLAPWIALAACGSSPPRSTAPLAAPTPGSPSLRYTRTELGTRRGHATRTTFVLTWEGDRAALSETFETDPRSLTILEADREPRWQLAGTHGYRGTRRSAGAAIELELEARDAQPLHLRCEHRTVTVAVAGTRPAAPAPQIECPAAAGPVPATTPVAVLVCGAAAQDRAEADPDDQLVFGATPGVEWIDENDGCASPLGGLRLAR